MEPDKYQRAWQSHTSQTRVTVDADLLLKEVRRNQRAFRKMISLRDSGEIALSMLVLSVWIYLGATMASPWTWYLMVPASLWIIGFILVVRARHRPPPNDPGEPLLSCVKESLALVDHQIWLRRKVFWWFILPTVIPMLAFTAQVSWLKSRDWLDALSDVNALIFAFLLALLCFLYYMNQRGAGREFGPRRQELLTLLAGLGDESTSKD